MISMPKSCLYSRLRSVNEEAVPQIGYGLFSLSPADLGRYYDIERWIIREKGASFEALNLPSTAGIQDENIRRLINTVIIEVYKYVAESERKKIRERQRQGIEIAKREGRYKGGQFKFKENDPRLQLAFKFYKEGKTIRELCRLTGIPTATFNRYKKTYGITRKADDE